MNVKVPEGFNSKIIKKTMRTYFENHKTSAHGVKHWLRVMYNGLYLASLNSNVDPLVVSYFAVFHDCKRKNENQDPEHGLRAAKFAKRHKDILNLTDEQFDKLYYACEHHTSAHLHDDPTIGACFDSDRLDLGRVNIKTDAWYLSLEESKEILEERYEDALLQVFNSKLAKELGVTL